MIKLLIGKDKKEKLFTNKQGLKILQKNDPKEKYRIAKCEDTGKQVVQVWLTEDKYWLCLHDD